MQETLQKHNPNENGDRKRIHSPGLTRGLWFERLISKLHLPLWLGIPVVSLGPAVVLWWLGITIRIATDFTGVIPVSLPLLVLNMLFLIGASRLIRIHIANLRRYASTLTPNISSGFLNRLYGIGPIILIWALLVVASGTIFDPLIFKLFYSPYQSLLRVVVTSYIRFAQATFLWVLGFSMYSISNWGRLPVRLKSFTEDPTLGLRPFGTASLHFVTLYVIGVLLTFPIGVYNGDAVRISQSAFFLLGLAMFLGPLSGLRSQLLHAKREKLEWIGSRHRRIMELVESTGDAPFDIGIANELIAVDSIRRDVQQINTWPFNFGILAKLVTVVMLPLVVAMIATYLIRILQL